MVPEETRNPQEHDILVVRRPHPDDPGVRQYFKVRVERQNGRIKYAAPAELGAGAPGHRSIVNIACGETLDQEGEQPALRGPALSTLPLHPDPTASAACTCYLMNPDNLRYETSWTHEEWNDQDVQPPEGHVRSDDAFELLVATAAGNVYLLQKSELADAPWSGRVDVRREPELWNQLRNGCVAGSVLLVAHPPANPRVVPVVNVESLTPPQPQPQAAAAARD